MRPACFGPLPEERCEVTAVASDENPLLRCRQGQNLGIGQTVEIGSFAQGLHVVANLTQRARDPST